MFDPFMMGGDDGFLADPYGLYEEEEPDEHEELLMRLAACIPMYKCGTFEDTLESVCYVCNIERESLSEEDVDLLGEIYEEEE